MDGLKPVSHLLSNGQAQGKVVVYILFSSALILSLNTAEEVKEVSEEEGVCLESHHYHLSPLRRRISS